MSNIIERDVVIIGAGPSGLFCVFECGFMGYSCAVVDSLPEIGGQLAALYPEKPIFDIPGHPEILAGDLVKNLEKQNAPYDPIYLTGAPAEKLERHEDGTFSLYAGSNHIKSKVVIVAAGGGMFSPRKPKLSRLDEFEETSIFYAVKDKSQYAGKNIVIAGGGDSAVDWAVELAATAKHVHVVHRRADFRAADAMVDKMEELAKAGKITIHTPSQVDRLQGENGQLSSIDLKDNDGEITSVDADIMLCFFGMVPSLGPLAEWGLDLTKAKKIEVDAATMKTNVDGVLAIGDIADYAGRMHLILFGFAEASRAAKSARAIIDPDKANKKIPFSTSRGGE